MKRVVLSLLAPLAFVTALLVSHQQHTASYDPASASSYIAGENCVDPAVTNPVHPSVEFGRVLDGLRSLGLDQDQVDAALAERLCMVRLNPVTAASMKLTASVPIDVDVRAPTVYFNTQGRYYTLDGHWVWMNSGVDHIKNGERWGSGKDGGTDGWGLAANTKLMEYDVSAMWRGNCHYGHTYTIAAADISSYGVGFERQDWVNNGSSCWDFNHLHGDVIYMFTGTASGGCANVQAFLKYGHSYPNTSLTGISIGLYSVGISWDSSNNRWYRSSNGSDPIRICGTGR